MQFKFNHDIFFSENAPKITGEVKISVKREKNYTFHDGSQVSESELTEIVKEANEELSWPATEDQNEIMNRKIKLFELEKLIEEYEEVKVSVELLPGSSFYYSYNIPGDEGTTTVVRKAQWSEDCWLVEARSIGRDCDGLHSTDTTFREYPDGRTTRA